MSVIAGLKKAILAVSFLGIGLSIWYDPTPQVKALLTYVNLPSEVFALAFMLAAINIIITSIQKQPPNALALVPFNIYILNAIFHYEVTAMPTMYIYVVAMTLVVIDFFLEYTHWNLFRSLQSLSHFRSRL